MPAKKINSKFFNSPKARVFLLFLGLSFIFWLFSSLSEKYNYFTSFEVQYTDLPQDVIFQDISISKINVLLQATGFEILNHKLKTKRIKISVEDFKNLDADLYYFIPANHKLQVEKQLTSKINQIENDTLFVRLNPLRSKKVPVQLQTNITYKPGYKLTQAIQFQPDSILLTGPKNILEEIAFLKTETIVKDDVSKDFTFDVALELPNYKEPIEYSDKRIKVSGKIAKFTQATKEILIKVPDTDVGTQIILIPKKTHITFEVAFENYHLIDKNSFEISCDLTDSVLDREMLDLKVTKKPDFIKKYSLQPAAVRYLIKQD